MFYYTFTTFDCNFIPRNAEICKVSSKTKNVGKAHKYRLNRHLPTYEKIIKNLYSFYYKKSHIYLRVQVNMTFFFMISYFLLIPKCFNRVKSRRFVRRIVTEEHADNHGKYNGTNDGSHRSRCRIA